jgi:hypothetical protein
MLPATMDISARAISLADRPRAGPFGSPVFACAGKTEPPSRLILSQTSAGKSGERLLANDLRWLKLARLEGSATSKNAPGDACKLIGERDREHVAMQSFLGGLDPMLEAVAFPFARLHLHKHHPGCLHEQHA